MYIKNEEDFKKWLINEKGIPIKEAIQIINDLMDGFPPTKEQEELSFEYNLQKKLEKDQIITFKIQRIIKNELQRIAKENNMKLSEVIRSALNDFIDSYTTFERRLANEERNREEINRQGNIQKNSSKH